MLLLLLLGCPTPATDLADGDPVDTADTGSPDEDSGDAGDTGATDSGTDDSGGDDSGGDDSGTDDSGAPGGRWPASLLSTDAGLTLSGTAQDAAGRWVGIGDIDGDGAFDALVGAPQAVDDAGTAQGAFYAVSGPLSPGATALADAPFQVLGSGPTSGLGARATLGAGQLGVLGAEGVFLFDLPLAPGVASDASASASATHDYVIESLLVADADGDGLDDLLVGSPEEPTDALGAWVGAVYLFVGPVQGQLSTADAHSVLRGEYGYLGGSSYVGHFMGTDIAAGDLDGDGVADVAIGAVGSSLTTDAGTVYLYLGGLPAGDVALDDADAAITGESYEQPIGDDVVIGGDVDGDGKADLIASGAWSRYNGHPPGKVYVFADPIAASGVADAGMTYSGEEADDLAGEVADHAPDLDGDGAIDLVVGAYGNDTIDAAAGRAYVQYGPLLAGAWALGDADVVVSGANRGTQLGWSVDGGGDLDGDGLDDLIVGGPHTAEATAAWVFFGGGS